VICRLCLTCTVSSGDVMLRSANRLVDSWQRRCPDSLLDPPSVWDDVITNRFLHSDTDIDYAATFILCQLVSLNLLCSAFTPFTLLCKFPSSVSVAKLVNATVYADMVLGSIPGGDWYAY